jgi:hypothetical protein
MLRVQVTFIPQASGAISVCYAVTSRSMADGSRYLTDNLYIPFRRILSGKLVRRAAAVAALAAAPDRPPSRRGWPVATRRCRSKRRTAAGPECGAA